jgi:hypothetical protein
MKNVLKLLGVFLPIACADACLGVAYVPVVGWESLTPFEKSLETIVEDYANRKIEGMTKKSVSDINHHENFMQSINLLRDVIPQIERTRLSSHISMNMEENTVRENAVNYLLNAFLLSDIRSSAYDTLTLMTLAQHCNLSFTRTQEGVSNVRISSCHFVGNGLLRLLGSELVRGREIIESSVFNGRDSAKEQQLAKFVSYGVQAIHNLIKPERYVRPEAKDPMVPVDDKHVGGAEALLDNDSESSDSESMDDDDF